MSKKVKESKNQEPLHKALSVKSESENTGPFQCKLEFLFKELADDQSFFLICYALFHHDTEISIGASLVLGHLKDSRALTYLLRAL